jgi:predicted transcriptional regulator
MSSSSYYYQKENKLLKLLSETKIKDLPGIQEQHLIYFKSNQNIQQVLHDLVKNHILSAPVYDIQKKQYIGMIDFRDFAELLLSLYIKGENEITTAGSLSDMSGTNPFSPIQNNCSLLEVLREFNVKNIHRMPVIEKDPHKILYILSPSFIVSWFAKNLDKFSDFMNFSVKEVNLGGLANDLSQVLTIKEEETVLAAFSLIAKYNIHGIAVISKEGKLIGNISVRDLKYIIEESMDNLKLSIHHFFKKITGTRPPLVYCYPTTKFVDVIKLIDDSKVHRIHVINQEGKPIDIITPSNILDTVLALATGSRRR